MDYEQKVAEHKIKVAEHKIKVSEYEVKVGEYEQFIGLTKNQGQMFYKKSGQLKN